MNEPGSDGEERYGESEKFRRAGRDRLEHRLQRQRRQKRRCHNGCCSKLKGQRVGTWMGVLEEWMLQT